MVSRSECDCLYLGENFEPNNLEHNPAETSPWHLQLSAQTCHTTSTTMQCSRTRMEVLVSTSTEVTYLMCFRKGLQNQMFTPLALHMDSKFFAHFRTVNVNDPGRIFLTPQLFAAHKVTYPVSPSRKGRRRYHLRSSECRAVYQEMSAHRTSSGNYVHGHEVVGPKFPRSASTVQVSITRILGSVDASMLLVETS